MGDGAEWIFERPSVGESVATLTNYVATAFHACTTYASVGGGTYNRPYYPGQEEILVSIFNIMQCGMLNNNGDAISTAILTDLVMLGF